MSSNLSACSFMESTFDVSSNKSLAHLRPHIFSHIFSSGNFIVLDFTFRSMIRIEFVSQVMQDTNTRSFFSYKYPNVPAYLLKDYPFSTALHLILWQKSGVHVCGGLFLDSLFCSIGLIVSLYTSITQFLLLQFYNNF